MFLSNKKNKIQKRETHIDLIKDSTTTKCERKIPKVININSISKYEVDRIHNYVMSYYDNIEKTIPDKKLELMKLKNEDISLLNHVDQMAHFDIISRKEKEIKLILEDKSRNDYLNKISPLLDKYRDLFKDEDEKVFGMENEVSIDITREMVSMISIINYFTPLEFNFNIKIKPCCACCNYDFTDLTPDSDGILRCPICAVENDVSHITDSFMEVERISPSIYCDYNVENNFIKFLDKFQGKIPCTLNKNVYKRLLDEYFSKKKKDIGDVVKKRNYDFKGFKEGTSLETMLIALKEIGLSDFYDDVYFISKKYWGWILADLDENKEKIIFIYEATQTAYKNIENKKRSSSISIPFHTLKILELIGYKYSVSDFKIPKDEKSKRELEEYWKITCANCKNPLIYYKATKWES